LKPAPFRSAYAGVNELDNFLRALFATPNNVSAGERQYRNA
jgi:hypothetical protein